MEQESVSPPGESQEKTEHVKSPSPAVALAESEGKIEAKTEIDEEEKPKVDDLLAVEEGKKDDVNKTPKANVSTDEIVSAAESEEQAEDKKCETSKVGKDSEIPKEESARETIEERIKQQPEPLLAEAVEGKLEAALAKEAEHAKGVSAIVSAVEEKPKVQPADTEGIQKESEVAEPKEYAGVAVARYEETSIGKIESSKMKTDAEDAEMASESVEKAGNVVEPAEAKIEAESEAKEVKTEEEEKIEENLPPVTTVKIEEEKTEKPEESMRPEKNVKTEKGEKLEEPRALGSKEVALIESEKDAEEAKTITTTNAPLEKPQQPETEAKAEENAQAVESKLVTEKEADDADKQDVQSTEKTVSPVKTKQPSNFLSKLKQSLAKAKKAIMGNSTNSNQGDNKIK